MDWYDLVGKIWGVIVAFLLMGYPLVYPIYFSKREDKLIKKLDDRLSSIEEKL